MVSLGRMEAPQGQHLGHRWAGVGVGSLQLGQGLSGGTLLVGIGVEDGGAILAAHIRALAVEFGWVVGHREEHGQELVVGDPFGVEADAHGLGMATLAAADLLVAGMVAGSPRIARHHCCHAPDVLEDCLDAPETAARQHRGGLAPGLPSSLDPWLDPWLDN